MLPGQRRGVSEQLVCWSITPTTQMLDGVRQIGRVLVDNGSDHQVQAGGAELLCVLAAIGDALT